MLKYFKSGYIDVANKASIQLAVASLVGSADVRWMADESTRLPGAWIRTHEGGDQTSLVCVRFSLASAPCLAAVDVCDPLDLSTETHTGVCIQSLISSHQAQ